MLIPILIFAVLAIVLIFSLIKSAETWNWIPITCVALIFLTGIFGGIAASRSLKIRNAWKTRYMENERILAQMKSETDLALFGEEGSVGGYGEGSLRDVTLKLRLAQIGKGRVWGEGTPARNGDQYTISFEPRQNDNTDPNAYQAPVTSPAAQIKPDMQLFAFEASNRVVDPGGAIPPAADFVGSFKVVSTDTTAGSIAVEAVFLTKFYHTGSLMRHLAKELTDNANADKINRLFIELDTELAGELNTEFVDIWNAGEGSGDMSAVIAWLDDKSTGYEPDHKWALFESMPGDSRTAFVDHAGLEPFSDDNPATPENLAALRELLTTVYLPAEMLGMDPASEEYEFLIDQYNFDGAKVNEINQYINQNSAGRVNDRFTMLADNENLFVKVKFNETSEAFSVDGSSGARLGPDGAFDITGRANNPDLKLGKDVTLPKDTEIVLPKGPALEGNPISNQERGPSVVSRNDADSMEVEYFVRPLRDYPYQLEEYRDLTSKATNARRAIESDIDVTKEIVGDTDSQKQSRTVIVANLNADIDSMEAAKVEIDRLFAERQAQLDECKAMIRTSYNQIMEMYRQVDPNSDFLDTSTQKPEGSLAGSSK